MRAKIQQPMTCEVECGSSDWLSAALEMLRVHGYVVVASVLSPETVARASEALYNARSRIREDLGRDPLETAKDSALRLPMCYDPTFYLFLEVAPMLAILDRFLSPAAILRFQNGSILEPFAKTSLVAPHNHFHVNFPYARSDELTLGFAFQLSDFTQEIGFLETVRGSHRLRRTPSAEYLKRKAEPVRCGAGSMLVLNSRLWHRASLNHGDEDLLTVEQQFAREYVKPHFDHIHAVGAEALQQLSPRTRYLLGWKTRMPASLHEFYVPEADQLYRPGFWMGEEENTP